MKSYTFHHKSYHIPAPKPHHIGCCPAAALPSVIYGGGGCGISREMYMISCRIVVHVECVGFCYKILHIPHTFPYQAVCNQISCQILQNPCTAHMPPGCLLGTSKNSGKSLCFCMSPQKGCQHQYNINYINSQKPLKTL